MKKIMPGILHVRHDALKIFILTAVVTGACFFTPVFEALTVTDAVENELLLCKRVKEGDLFSIRYIHSVNKSPVEDFFLIGNNHGIVLDKSVFYSFGAGVPSAPEDGGSFQVYKDRIEVTGINGRIDDFLMFVGVTAEHRFRIKGEDILLRSIIPPQRNIRFAVEKISLFRILLHC